MNNALNNNTFMCSLKELCKKENIKFNKCKNYIYCIAHIINLAVQNALKMLKTSNITKENVELNISSALVLDLIFKMSKSISSA